MVEIAMNQGTGGVYQKDISKNQDLSNKYLDHIIHGLKVAGLIRKKGKRGGYVLTREPSRITVYDINKAFEPEICIIECLHEGIQCDREKDCETKEFWSKLNNLIISHYQSVTLEDLVLSRKSLEVVK